MLDRIESGFVVAGIDFSLSNTAIAIVRDGDVVYVSSLSTKYIKTDDERAALRENLKRYQLIISFIVSVIEKYSPKEIGIESYAFGVQNSSSVHKLAEATGILKYLIAAKMKKIVHPISPLESRKIVFGQTFNSTKKKKVDTKECVQNELVKLKYNQFTNNDEADAIVIALALEKKLLHPEDLKTDKKIEAKNGCKRRKRKSKTKDKESKSSSS